MFSRRTILQAGIGGGVALFAGSKISRADSKPFSSGRPAVQARLFTSPAVESFIQTTKSKIADPEIAWMFENCYPNTLDTTVEFDEHGGEDGKPDSFILTGDIAAMWQRDSTAEVWPYLPLVKHDPHLQAMFQGTINRQAQNTRLDPYANAYYKNSDEVSEWLSDQTMMKPGVHERKWEIDSLCWTVRLAHGYWKETGDTTPFDSGWEKAADLIVQTFREQQRKNGHGPYYFRRGGDKLDLSLDSSYGPPLKPVGLIYSAFRPSDDATEYPFLVPSNYFAVVSLHQLAEMLHHIRHQPAKAQAATELAQEVAAALRQYAVFPDGSGSNRIAYEVNGLGDELFMDDSNVPSLMSLAYLGAFSANDPLYQTSRKLAWTPSNPWFSSGKYTGIGSPHTGPGTIWPIGLCMYALTSQSEEVVSAVLSELKATHAGTGFMHESFNMDNPNEYTRSWFAWANSMFGELVADTAQRYPKLLGKTF
jgi:meiotically up-regulated gene 157 (Mug157) protein